MGLDKCQRCNIEFEEDDVIATSTSNRYCYGCAVRVNLVSGNIQKDLCNDKFVSGVLNEIRRLAKKYSIVEEVSSFALFLVKTAFENNNHVTKNRLGLSCAAISLAANQLGKDDSFWNGSLPVSLNVLERNISELQKRSIQTRVILSSQNINGVRN